MKTTIKKISQIFLFLALLSLFPLLSSSAHATIYNCPNPEQIRCVPVVSFVGQWVHNGGQTTGNRFSPNDQCANVISLGALQQRLVCCYEKCGVFIRTVRSTRCSKLNEATFECR